MVYSRLESHEALDLLTSISADLRIIAKKDIPLPTNAHFTNLYGRLNPAALRKSIDRKVDKRWERSKELFYLSQRSFQSNFFY